MDCQSQLTGRKTFNRALAGLATVLVIASGSVANARPVVLPNTQTTTTVSVTTNSNIASYSASVGYEGAVLSDAVPFSGSNIRSFNSVNSFGRRTFVANSGPQHQVVLNKDTESLITHALFKVDFDSNFFSSVDPNSTITIQVDDILFSEPVTVLDDTIMLHSLWRDAQVSQFPPATRYQNPHNHFTIADPFRNAVNFFQTGVFVNFPVNHFVFNADGLGFGVSGEGTDTLDITVSFPYSMLKHLQEEGQPVPEGLPAPGGFLEPFHFHLEYVVTPEPSTLILLGASVAFGAFRRSKRRSPDA